MSWCATTRCPKLTSPRSGAAVAITIASVTRSCFVTCAIPADRYAPASDRRPPLLVFVADQIDALPDSIDEYLATERNRQRHAVECRSSSGFVPSARVLPLS